MKVIILTVFLIVFSTKAFSEKLFCMCYDDMIVTTHKLYKEDYPNEFNIFNLDLKSIKLTKITSINKQRHKNTTILKKYLWSKFFEKKSIT